MISQPNSVGRPKKFETISIHAGGIHYQDDRFAESLAELHGGFTITGKVKMVSGSFLEPR